jgi:hypothetical protein
MSTTGSGRLVAIANVFLTGVLLGALQWSVFFLLQSYLASTAVVYLLGTCAWMLGSVLGLAAPGEGKEPWWLAASVASYFLFRALASAHPYQLGWLPVLLVTIAGIGGYAGRFFQCRRGVFTSAKWLFFNENCGFLVGMASTVAALTLWGAQVLLSVPLALAVVVAVSLWALPRPGPAAQSAAGRQPHLPSAGGD